MPDLQTRYQRLLLGLSFVTILAGCVLMVWLMAASRSALGIPMGSGSLDGMRLKFFTWLAICLVSIPVAFYLARMFVYGAFALAMVSAGRFTAAEARHFALSSSYPSSWHDVDGPRPIGSPQSATPDAWTDERRNTLLSGLISGDPHAVTAFGEAPHCVVVDWRDGAEEILEALTPFLPEGYLSVRKIGGGRWSVRAGERPSRTIAYGKATRQEDFLLALNEVLTPDFELWQYTPVDGDGYSFFVAPAAWWQSLADEHPKVLKKYFLPMSRLAAHVKKPYLRRLFGRP